MRCTGKNIPTHNDQSEERKKAELQKKADMAELEQMEKTIKTGLDAFVTVGHCLAEINKRKLYRLRGFHSFTEYCEVQFNMSRVHGHRQIAHITMCQTIGEDPSCVPERATRPLAKLQDTETIQQIWQEAKRENGDKMPTGGDITRHIERYQHDIKLKKKMLPLSSDKTSAPLDAAQPDQSGIFQKMYGSTSQTEPSTPATIYCKTFERDLPVDNIAGELIAETAKLAQTDENATPEAKLLNQADKLSSAAYELRLHLLSPQRNAIRAEYQRLTGELIDAWMAVPADADNITSDPGTGSAPERS